MLAKFFQPWTGIFLVVWLLLMIGGRDRLFRDPGTFWHTVVGEHILSTGEFIRADPFTWTNHGKFWIAHQWLGEAVMAVLHRLSGLDGLLLGAVTLLAGIYAWLGQRLIRSGLHWSLALVLVVLVIAASAYHFHIRPHLATIALMGLLFGRLIDFESGRIGPRGLLWLLPLFLLWTNVHGGTLGGLATLALVFAGWTVNAWFGKESPLRMRQVPWLLVLAAGCGLMVLINPYGLDMPRVWLSIMDAELPELIEEHAPLEWGSGESWCLAALAALYVFVLAGTWPRWPRVTWLIPLVWFALTCLRIRHGPLFALTAGLGMAAVFPHTRWAAWLLSKGSDWFQPPPNAGRKWDLRPVLLPALLVCVTLVSQRSAVSAPVVGSGWAQLDAELWPVELRPALRSLSETTGVRLFNEYSFGGFIIFFAPPLPVFIDDRCELFLEDGLLEAYGKAYGGDRRVLEGWDQRYRFTHALTRPGSAFDGFFAGRPGWKRLGRCPSAHLYERLSPEDSRAATYGGDGGCTRSDAWKIRNENTMPNLTFPNHDLNLTASGERCPR